MTDTKKPAHGGPAFPFTLHNEGSKTITDPYGYSLAPGRGATYTGMDLRDHFAGLAMQAAATNPTGADGFTFSERAAWAYQQADAMLEARDV